MNEKLLNRIISVAYRDADFLEKLKIYFLAAGNSEVKRLLSEYKATAKAVHKLEQEECPQEILARVKNNTLNKENNFTSKLVKLLYAFLYKPVLTTAVILVLATGMMFLILFNKPEQKQYSKAQIHLAEKQVKQSLALVSKVFNRTANRVENDIIKKQVAKPVNEGISTINDLFKGG